MFLLYFFFFYELGRARRAARSARADGQPLARLTPGFQPLIVMRCPLLGRALPVY